MSSADNQGLGAVGRLAVVTAARSSPRRLCCAFVLLVLAVVWTVEASAQASLPCAGDCDKLGSVTIEELVTGVNIALDILPVYRCPLCDVDLNGKLTVDELVTAVNNALYGCPSGELSFDEFPVAMLPRGQETVGVSAKDENGNELDWTAASSAPNVVSAVKNGDVIELTGLSPGSAVIMVTTHSELRPLRRSLPVRVYDPFVLDAGELLIRYVSTFECLPVIPPFYSDASFYRPVVPEGWRRLAMFGVATAGCPNVNGQQWMIAVKANPERANLANPPLVEPTSYHWTAGFGHPGYHDARFWFPECPAGYVAMGALEQAPDVYPYSPTPDDATCVREDLTVPGVAGATILKSDWTNYVIRTAAPENVDFDVTTTYLETGAFRAFDQPGFRVLAIDPPPLIDAPQQTWLPHVSSFLSSDNLYPEPLLAKALLVPFTAILSGNMYLSRGVGWMLGNSPFVRVERVVDWDQVFFAVNTGSTEQNHSRTFTKGISTESSTTISHTAGVSVTAETGVKFLGNGGKVSATVSYQFGYQSQHSVGQLEEESTNVSINVPPHKAAAAWRQKTTILVKLHNPNDGTFDPIVSQPMYDSLSFVTDDYPDSSSAIVPPDSSSPGG